MEKENSPKKLKIKPDLDFCCTFISFTQTILPRKTTINFVFIGCQGLTFEIR